MRVTALESRAPAMIASPHAAGGARGGRAGSRLVLMVPCRVPRGAVLVCPGQVRATREISHVDSMPLARRQAESRSAGHFGRGGGRKVGFTGVVGGGIGAPTL